MYTSTANLLNQNIFQNYISIEKQYVSFCGLLVTALPIPDDIFEIYFIGTVFKYFNKIRNEKLSLIEVIHTP